VFFVTGKRKGEPSAPLFFVSATRAGQERSSGDNDEGIAIEGEDPVARHQNKRFDESLGHNEAVEGIVVVTRECFHL